MLKFDKDIRYFPNFINEAEEQHLLNQIYAAPKPKWRALSNRRLQNWGGAVAGNQCLIVDEPLPKWLETCIDKIMTEVPEGSFPYKNRPNHVLINEYLPGQGIMPHTDGPAFFPLISTISLGSHCLLNFYEQQQQSECSNTHRDFVGSLLLEPRSLVLISGHAYELLHGIDECDSDIVNDTNSVLNWTQLGQQPEQKIPLMRVNRVSMTIRNVPKVRRLLRCFPSK